MAKKTPTTQSGLKAGAVSRLVPTSELARQRGVSVQRISQYARDGMPRIKVDGKWHYDPAVCSKWIRENFPDDAAKGGERPGAGRPPKGKKSKAEPSPQLSRDRSNGGAEGAGVQPKRPAGRTRWVEPALDAEDDEDAELAMWADDEDRDPSGREPFNELRRRNELEKLRLARIERMQKEGQLVDVTEVRQEYTRKVSAAATHLRQAGRVLATDIGARFSVPSARVHELATMIDDRLHAVSLQLATQRYGGRVKADDREGQIGGDDAAG